ncbi:SAM-dependent methyltransferase [Faecalicatena sp. Marseille-Q4148]|nr:SAM-dependent methyltransferase [Faecalicatena sp. Marseille-Q4148]
MTKELDQVLRESFTIDFISAVLSNPREKEELQKVKIRPLLKGAELYFQLEEFRGKQAFHENVRAEEAVVKTGELMQLFKQMQIETKKFSCTVLISKKGKITIKKKAVSGKVKEVDLSHNRSKKYILQEGTPVMFLQDLGVMTADGKIVRTRFDKFRQINRFLEFIEDILPKLPSDREVTILDFGCGKSYLTFAMYYYLHELKKYDVRIIGLDLKTDVIRKCNELSEKYGYEKLRFLEGNIADYTGVDEVDMVVTLHACDTATDFALAKAVGWKAKVILSVPCCQHEMNEQIQNEILHPALKYGLIKERMAALFTDALRAEYLEREGYDTQILEFIDMEHTPKNILIRAVRTGRAHENGEEIKQLEDFLHVTPMLGKLLG